MVFKWLMDRKSRKDMLENVVTKKASTASTLTDLDREYTLNELCIVTRAGNAKTLGLKDRGHLGVGAIGDVAVYKLDPKKMDGHSIEKAFSRAAYTIKEGQIIVKNGEIMASPMGTLIRAEGKIKENNYAVQDAYAPKEKVIKTS
jgi:formylmethanofuran dehydrogenase subunit A